jgi:tetratricopeptide (TPR) repeat protein
MSLLLAWLPSPPVAWCEDRIVVAPPDTSGEIIIRGEILDLIGPTVRVRPTGSDNAQVIPVVQVVRIETTYHSDYRRGLSLLNEGQTAEAEEAFLAAYEGEPRNWVKREILTQLVQCAERRDDTLTAARRFLEIVATDPQSRFWGCAPIPWTPVDANPALQAEARIWLARADDADKFLGASWLLFDEVSHETAEAVLRELSRGTNAIVSPLATAQLWRVRLRDDVPSNSELYDWRDHIEFMPEETRCGPQALLAAAYQRRGDYEQAAAEWLWIATVYTQRDMLTARASFEAGECLLRLGRGDEAAGLFEEVADRFGWSPQAGPSQQRLSEIAEAGLAE